MKIFVSDTNFLTFVPMGLIDNMLSLVQVMPWRCIGHKPLPEPAMAHVTFHNSTIIGILTRKHELMLTKFLVIL